MKLNFPDNTVKFTTTPSYFLGGFNVYDREETFEEELNKYNPNDESHIKALMQNFFFNSQRAAKLTSEHRKELQRMLGAALSSPGFDFCGLLKDDDDECFYFPSEWNINNPRKFFESIYSVLNEFWE